jgi:hypothetical protein
MTTSGRSLAAALVGALLLSGCDGDEQGLGQEALTPASAAVSGEDGLAEAYDQFKQRFVGAGQDQRFGIGFGFHPGLVTTKVTSDTGVVANGVATLIFGEGRVQAQLRGVPMDQGFDLWFVKNVDGPGRSVKPEPGDELVKIGGFAPSTVLFAAQELDVVVGAAVDFDLDQVVVTRRGQHPYSDVVATGARTLLEKRFFRERAGKSLDPVTGTLLASVETTDALVARGAQLFFHETFGGNGRTCGTCHRAEDNLTLSPDFIATLPQSDPLFVAENVPELAELENPQLLRHDALIKEARVRAARAHLACGRARRPVHGQPARRVLR